MPLQYAIGFDTALLKPQAQVLAEQFNLIVDNETLPRLQLQDSGLCFVSQDFSPITIDFQTDLLRRRHTAAKSQGLFRACKPKSGLTVLDATAGWGRDAALLASWGCRVRMLERNPVMAALLHDALSKKPDAWELSLVFTQALSYLEQLSEADYPDVIYLDPMHPVRQKSALVKKEMQLLQQLLGPDTDALAVLQCAIGRARSRVVVKWPQKSPPLLKPSFTIEGSTVRFDVYASRMNFEKISAKTSCNFN